ncbi:MAG: thioredoxin family protein [Lentisphaerae bacterium]|nr:thioredoxin family protein [Lentisphaerota bacterium]
MKEVTRLDELEALSAGEQTLLLDFYMTTCPPCRRLAVELDALEAEGKLPVLLCKVDAERLPQAAARYGVRGVPAFFLIRSGKVLAQGVGYRTRAELAAWIETALNVEPDSGAAPAKPSG